MGSGFAWLYVPLTYGFGRMTGRVNNDPFVWCVAALRPCTPETPPQSSRFRVQGSRFVRALPLPPVLFRSRFKARRQDQGQYFQTPVQGWLRESRAKCVKIFRLRRLNRPFLAEKRLGISNAKEQL